MSSRGGPNSMGKNVSQGGSNPDVEHLNPSFPVTNLAPSQDDGGEWEAKKNKNKPGNASGKSWVSHSSNPHRAWAGQQQGRGNNVSGRGGANAWRTQPTDSRVFSGRGAGRGHPLNRGSDIKYAAPTLPPLEGGWNWQSRGGAAQQKIIEDSPNLEDDLDNASEEDDDSDALDDSDDDLVSDDYDSDLSQKSHGSRKQNKWFKKFFNSLDSLSNEQIAEPTRQWHCPACKGGPGAIRWFNLQPLLAHARTKGARRVKLHRELADILDKDLQTRGASHHGQSR